MQLRDIADYVSERISSDCVELENYITTDCLLSDKQGRAIATNLPPKKCALIKFQKGDILVSNIRPYLKKIWYADRNGGASTDVLVFRAKNEHLSTYLYSILLQDSFYNWTMKGPKGSRMPRGDKNQIMHFPIVDIAETAYPVGKLIMDLNEKISINRQINQNLEALARQLYDYWFVQFDFPNEEGKPYKSSGGKMVYNLILKREIPEGWEVKKLGELCSINKRTSNGRYNSPILYLDTASITNNNIEMLQFLDPEKDEIPSRARRVVMEGDIVYSTVRPNLKHFGLLYDPKSNMVVSTGFAVITANWSAFRYYIYQFLKQDKVVDNLHSIAQSAVSSYPSINASDIQNLDIVVPSNIQIDAFAHIACKIHAQLEIHAQQILSLTKQRDELLPLLMNGQVNFDLFAY